MDAIEEQELVKEVRNYVTENLPLSKMSDEDLEDRVEEIVTEKLRNRYCPVEQKVSIVKQVYSSIRGFGLLDSIISDDSITEVMINGADNIFIEKSGKLQKLDKQFESQRRLEDIIQRIVGLAGREVNQANPIVDTRLPDGSRVNVVLPPIALCGPTMTIRKFSKTPMTIERLIQYGSLTQEIADKLELLVRAGIYDEIKKYYHSEKIVGWYYSAQNFKERDLFYMRKMHLDHFAGNERREKGQSCHCT